MDIDHQKPVKRFSEPAASSTVARKTLANFTKYNEDDLSKFKAEIMNAKTADMRQKL